MYKQIKSLFLNGDANKPQCSVYEAGLSYWEGVKLSKYLDIEYKDVFNSPALNIQPNDRNLPKDGWDSGIPDDIESYDLIIINYADGPMSNLPLQIIRRMKKIMVITNDMYYESPWGFRCHLGSNAKNFFDYVGFPDPTFNSDDETVCVLPRLCPRFQVEQRTLNYDNPIISTYGFPSPEKQLHLIVEIINKEFKEATLRLHFPEASHQGWDMKSWIYNVYLECKSIAKPEVKVVFSNDYKTRNDIIQWLSESDLNVFLHNPERFFITMGALPASIDLAISAQRPIVFSNSMENRHVMSYQLPYPAQTFKESIQNGTNSVLNMYENWSPTNFSETLDSFLEKHFDLQ